MRLLKNNYYSMQNIEITSIFILIVVVSEDERSKVDYILSKVEVGVISMVLNHIVVGKISLDWK